MRAELVRAQAHSAAIRVRIGVLGQKATRVAWQAQLATESEHCLEIIDSVLSSVPSDVWLSRVDTAEKNSTVSIEGHAASVESVSGFITALGASRAFSQVQLAGTHSAGTNGLVWVDFSVSASLKTPATQVASSGEAPGAKEAAQ